MWDKIKHSFSEHPYIWGGGIFLLGVLLVWYFFSGSSSSTAAASTTAVPDNSAAIASEYATQASLSAAQSQQQMQLSLAGIQAGVVNNQTSASLDLGSLDLTTQLAGLEAQGTNQLSAIENQNSTALGEMQIQSADQIQQGWFTTATQLGAIDASVQQANINGGVTEFLASQSAATAAQMSNNQTNSSNIAIGALSSIAENTQHSSKAHG